MVLGCDREAARRIDRSGVAGLPDMRELMEDQALPGPRSGGELPLPEIHVCADGDGAGCEPRRGAGRGFVGVQACPGLRVDPSDR